MTTLELLARMVILTVLLAPVVALLLWHLPSASDAELHEAARRERERRQRDRWTSPDGRTVR